MKPRPVGWLVGGARGPGTEMDCVLSCNRDERWKCFPRGCESENDARKSLASVCFDAGLVQEAIVEPTCCIVGC